MVNEFHIRKVSSNDIPELLNLMNMYIVDFYKREKPNEFNLRALIQHLLDHPASGLQFGAEDQNGRLIGFATMYFTFSTLNVKRQAILNDLFVIPEARGWGSVIPNLLKLYSGE
ncbi:GNAT family N-acetyltransferase [Alkalihalobacterium elongatum]|uniref:GNAT family N-acetyltransferase n=1 Tax=Alkalihalobacterium elongatum TaxID=2675466 RepID=UPI0038B3B3D7